MAYGAPDSVDDVPAYLFDVRGGRETPESLVNLIKKRYELIGGKSPLLECTLEQARGVEALLLQSSFRCRAYVGMRHWHPYIGDTLRSLLEDGYKTILALCLVPHYSRLSIGVYYEELHKALAELSMPVEVIEADGWHAHPGFLGAIAESVVSRLDRFSDFERRSLYVLFTAHSLPESIRENNDPYEKQLRETSEGVIKLIDKIDGIGDQMQSRWKLCFQSAGVKSVPWIGPQLEEVLSQLASEGVKNVLVVPIGFVADNVEILYDIDIVAGQKAADLGIRLIRTELMNSTPLFLEALADFARTSIQERQGNGLHNR